MWSLNAKLYDSSIAELKKMLVCHYPTLSKVAQGLVGPEKKIFCLAGPALCSKCYVFDCF